MLAGAVFHRFLPFLHFPVGSFLYTLIVIVVYGIKQRIAGSNEDLALFDILIHLCIKHRKQFISAGIKDRSFTSADRSSAIQYYGPGSVVRAFFRVCDLKDGKAFFLIEPLEKIHDLARGLLIEVSGRLKIGFR